MVVRLWPNLTNRRTELLRPGHSLPDRRRPYSLEVECLETRELLDGGALASAYGQIPLSFEANQGQTDPAVQFLSRGCGYALYLTSQEAVLSLSRPVAPATGTGRQDRSGPDLPRNSGGSGR